MSHPTPDAGYYENSRPDVRRHLAGRYARALDVGCGAGVVSATLKKEGVVQAAEGVELFPEAADKAERTLDRVYRVDLSRTAEGLPAQAYDLVLCLDVLEHMVDPWAALRRVRDLMKPDGTLFVSLPNVRNFRVVLPLVLRGRWDYAESGLLDRTHIRFFTRDTARELLEQAGFEVTRVISPSFAQRGRAWWLNLLTFGLFRGFLEFQFFLFARPRKP